MSGLPEGIPQPRLDKLGRIRDRGADPYPVHSERSHTSAEALAAFAPDAESQPTVAVAGRLVASRPMGKSTFAQIMDGAGRIQLYFKRDLLGDEVYARYKELDLGDFIQARGTLFRTRTGEITVEVAEFAILTKSLRPLPEKWHGLADIEIRYRQRYLDLIANSDVKETFLTRSRIISAVRHFLDDAGFIEVETPVLNAQAGGAAARPFSTHHNALDRDLFLRIAVELHLKRLLVGGFDKVYEIGRVFRNEGIDAGHNPEFTLMESYQAYADYLTVAEMVENLVSEVAKVVTGGTKIDYQGVEIELAPPWRRITMREALMEYAGLDIFEVSEAEALRERMKEMGVDAPSHLGWGKLIDELVSAKVEPRLVQPTFLMDYPAELSPLAKLKPGEPRLVERFEAFVAGAFEFANAYSELNDPIDQRRRFEEQASLKAAGDDEAELVDEDFLIALEHGMPPAGGLGIGIDRLVMLLTNQRSIREVILFPQLRSKS